MMKKYYNNHVHSKIHLAHRQTVLLRRVVEEIFARWSIVCLVQLSLLCGFQFVRSKILEPPDVVLRKSSCSAALIVFWQNV